MASLNFDHCEIFVQLWSRVCYVFGIYIRYICEGDKFDLNDKRPQLQQHGCKAVQDHTVLEETV